MEVVIDADTGNEIIHFVRRGRAYLYLRDPTTKRFIRRLKNIELRVFAVVDYSKERAKKGNPLYVDAIAFSRLTPEEYPNKSHWIEKLSSSLSTEVGKMFGYYVVSVLLEPAGVEFGSHVRTTTIVTEGSFEFGIVWKHHPDQRGQYKTEVGTL